MRRKLRYHAIVGQGVSLAPVERDVERDMTIHETRLLLKVSKDAMRKNHYKHMHSKPAPEP